MAMFSAVLLGIIEGVTEFLPISSTGHLILADRWLDAGIPNHVFEIVIQLGAILAVVWLYRQKFISVVKNLAHEPSAQHFTRNILLAFLPAMIVGGLAHNIIKEALFNATVVAMALIVGGIAILIVERIKPVPTIASTEAMSGKTALMIGLFQCLAMIPGVSRAGATILGAMLCKVTRPAAAEFSFFLAVPTMLAATSLDLYQNYAALSADGLMLIAAGFVSAFITALIVVKWLVTFVQHHGFEPFAYYRIVVGLLMILFLPA
jgi:undecaprenyl-diphosphatase